MFYPPSAVCAEHEKSNAGNPISLRLRPLISPLLVMSFQRSAVAADRVWDSHLHPFKGAKNIKNGETRVKRDNFTWQERDKVGTITNCTRRRGQGPVLLLKGTNVSFLYGPDKWIKIYEIFISPTDHNKVWVCQRCHGRPCDAQSSHSTVAPATQPPWYSRICCMCVNTSPTVHAQTRPWVGRGTPNHAVKMSPRSGSDHKSSLRTSLSQEP